MEIKGEHTKKKRKKKNGLSKIAIFLGLFFGFPQLLFAADLLLAPSSASFSVGQTFNVRVEVNPDGESVNAVETQVSFDQTKLSVASVSKTGSIFSLWTTEPEFSNSAGTVDLGGGSPTPFSRSSTILTITFRALAPGSAEVSFNNGSVLAADGRGTDVLEDMRASVYTINEAVSEPDPEPDPEPSGNGPPAPVVESESHPDEEVWYQEDTAEFTWNIPTGVDTVRLLLGSQPDSVPTVPYTPPIDTRIIDDLDEGISYFHVQFRNEAGWGPVTHRKIQIDTTPPLPFEVVVVEANASTTPPSLSFATTDETSGIKHYEILIQDEEPVILTPEELAELPNRSFEMPRLLDGTYLVVVRAVDLADNAEETDVSVLLETGNVPEESAPQVLEEEIDEGINWGLVLTVLLLFIVFFLIGIIYIQRKRFLKERDYLRRETREIRERMEKIFTVLQDELEEQIASLDNKPRLSANEKRVLKSLREALEVSEALINKEIEDVEKVLK